MTPHVDVAPRAIKAASIDQSDLSQLRLRELSQALSVVSGQGGSTDFEIEPFRFGLNNEWATSPLAWASASYDMADGGSYFAALPGFFSDPLSPGHPLASRSALALPGDQWDYTASGLGGEGAAWFAGDGSAFSAGADFLIGAGAGAQMIEPSMDLWSDGGVADPQHGSNNYVDENGNGRYDQGEELLATGRRRPGEFRHHDDWGEGGGEGVVGGGDGGGGTGGGGGGGIGTATPVATHTDDCTTENGAAVQVADAVKGTGPSDGIRTSSGANWISVEFGAVIVRNADGSFGALNDSIYSDGQPGGVTLPGNFSAVYVGEIHNHPPRSDDPAVLNVDKYPSGNDWAGLAIAAKSFAPGSSSDPSLWIMGPDGVTREFRLSERNAIEAMSRDKLERGEDLNGRERTKSCG